MRSQEPESGDDEFEFKATPLPWIKLEKTTKPHIKPEHV
jgi:hypothetical protein